MQARSDVKQKVAFLPSSSRQCQTLFYFDQKGKSVNCESTIRYLVRSMVIRTKIGTNKSRLPSSFFLSFFLYSWVCACGR